MLEVWYHLQLAMLRCWSVLERSNRLSRLVSELQEETLRSLRETKCDSKAASKPAVE